MTTSRSRHLTVKATYLAISAICVGFAAWRIACSDSHRHHQQILDLSRHGVSLTEYYDTDLQKWLSRHLRIGIPHAIYMTLRDELATPEMAHKIATLQNVTVLYVVGSDLTEQFFDQLLPVRTLRYIYFSQCRLTEQCALALARMSSIESITFDQCHIDDTFLTHLSELSTLQSLHAVSCRRVTGVGFRSWRNHRLRLLNLYGSEISSDGLASIAENLRLTYLDVSSDTAYHFPAAIVRIESQGTHVQVND